MNPQTLQFIRYTYDRSVIICQIGAYPPHSNVVEEVWWANDLQGLPMIFRHDGIQWVKKSYHSDQDIERLEAARIERNDYLAAKTRIYMHFIATLREKLGDATNIIRMFFAWLATNSANRLFPF